MEHLRAALFADEHEDRIGVVDALLNKARKGDIRAIELCMYYAIGKPTESIDLTVGIRAAASRLAGELGIDDSAVQAQVDDLIAAAKRR